MRIYHKPSCVTCKKSISAIREAGIKDVEVRDFFKDPFSEKELRQIIKMSGKSPRDLLRKRDKMYKELDLENSKKTDSQIIRLMVEHPGLIMRPIVVAENDKTLVGKIQKDDLA